jgi:hypothetical protein
MIAGSVLQGHAFDGEKGCDAIMPRADAPNRNVSVRAISAATGQSYIAGTLIAPADIGFTEKKLSD